jgi:hypothetical protein
MALARFKYHLNAAPAHPASALADKGDDLCVAASALPPMYLVQVELLSPLRLVATLLVDKGNPSNIFVSVVLFSVKIEAKG